MKKIHITYCGHLASMEQPKTISMEVSDLQVKEVFAQLEKIVGQRVSSISMGRSREELKESWQHDVRRGMTEIGFEEWLSSKDRA